MTSEKYVKVTKSFLEDVLYVCAVLNDPLAHDTDPAIKRLWNEAIKKGISLERQKAYRRDRIYNKTE
jgi:hypothetical protein